MPRPPRCRRICGAPQVDTFCPNGCENTEPILLTLDEYEVIRLVDLEQQTHERCAAQMDISRSTVQEIYESARRKIAACLVHGKPLHITGGNYRICGGQEAAHCGRCCRVCCFRSTNRMTSYSSSVSRIGSTSLPPLGQNLSTRGTSQIRRHRGGLGMDAPPFCFRYMPIISPRAEKSIQSFQKPL